MNVYDFDGTIYKGDSTIDFYNFILMHKPLLALEYPLYFVYFIKYKFKLCTKTKMKEKFLSYTRYFTKEDLDKYVKKFWDKNYNKIFKYYFENHKSTDVVISASPSFSLLHICNRLGVKLICTEFDLKTCKIIGENCFGEEKVKRYKNVFGDAAIDNFYSDSYNDEPLAKIAKKAFMVDKDGNLSEWKFKGI